MLIWYSLFGKFPFGESEFDESTFVNSTLVESCSTNRPDTLSVTTNSLNKKYGI